MCIGLQLSRYHVESTANMDSHSGDVASLSLLAQEIVRSYASIDRHWCECDANNIGLSTIWLERSLKHLHANDQNSNANCLRTQAFSLPFLQFLTDRLTQTETEYTRNLWQLLTDANCLEGCQQTVGKWSQETHLAGDSLYRTWTRGEESLLIEWREQGKSFVEIGAALGRTDLVVACKYLELVPLPESELDGRMHQDSGQFNSKQKVPAICEICVYSPNCVGCSVHNGVPDVKWSLFAISGCSPEAYCGRCEAQMLQPANGHW
jgi:hypothetical protein